MFGEAICGAVCPQSTRTECGGALRRSIRPKAAAADHHAVSCEDTRPPRLGLGRVHAIPGGVRRASDRVRLQSVGNSRDCAEPSLDECLWRDRGVVLVRRAIPLAQGNPRVLAAGLFYAIAQGFIPLWFFQGLERMRLAATLEISGRIVGLCSIFVFVRSSEDTWVALFIQGIAPAITTVAGLIMAYRQI